MSADKDDIRRRLEAMSGEPPEAPAEPTVESRPARPARPAAPTPSATPKIAPAAQPTGYQPAANDRPTPPRPAAPTRPAAPPPASVAMTSGLDALGGSMSPMLMPSSDVAAAQRAKLLRDRADRRATLFPPCLTLGVSLPMMAGGWFLLDRFSVLRANDFGIAIPIALAAVGLMFLAIVALLMLQARADATPVPSQAAQRPPV